MPNPLESLQTLLRVRTPQHVQTGDPFLARRQSEIASGLDEWIPDADSPDYKLSQMEIGKRTGWSPARADMRGSDISNLRRVLGIGQIEHEQGLERAAAPPQIAGEYNLRERALANEGQLAVEDKRQAGARGMQKDYFDYLGEAGIDPSRISRGGVSVSTGMTRQRPSPTDAMEKRLLETRSSYLGPMGRMQRMIGMSGGKDDYVNSLTSALTRMGSLEGLQAGLPEIQQAEGNTIEERIINAGYDPSSLHPYEREWLELMVGQ